MVTITLQRFDADVRHPESAALVGHGSMFALSDEKGLITHRGGNGQINVYIALKTPEPWVTSSGIDFRDTEAAKLRLLNHFAGWNDQLHALIAESDAELLPLLLIVSSLESRTGLTRAPNWFTRADLMPWCAPLQPHVPRP